MKLDPGFPEGPAKMADEARLNALVETLDERRQATEAARYEAVDLLRDRAERGEGLCRSGDDERAAEF